MNANYHSILGDYDTSPLSRAEEHRLVPLAQAGDKAAFQKLVQHNVCFVISTARLYWREDSPIELDELISEGVVGLITAIERFDISSGHKLITYAVWWIRQSISNYLDRNIALVRRPQGRRNIRLTIEPHVSRITLETGDPPDAEQLAELTGISADRIQATIEEPTTDVSIEAPVAFGSWSDEKPLTIGETVLIDEKTPDESTEQGQRLGILESCLSVLTDRQRLVVVLHYGLQGNQPHNLSQIAPIIGFTRERIRQIRNEALAIMKQAHDHVILTE